MKTIITVILLGFVVGLMLLAAFPTHTMGDLFDGDRAGQISKFSHTGLFCKTWEGQMNLGGMRRQEITSSDGKSTMSEMVPNTFEFTVGDLAIVPKIQAALDSGDRVTLHYKHGVIVSPCGSSTGYFIDKVK